MGEAFKGLIKDPEMVGERPLAVDVCRSADLPGDLLDRDLFALELISDVMEIVRGLFLRKGNRRLRF